MQGQPSSNVETSVHGSLPPDAALAGALLDLVRDTEAELDIRASELERDASALPRDDADQRALITNEAAYVAGQRSTLDRVAEVIADVVKSQAEEGREEQPADE